MAPTGNLRFRLATAADAAPLARLINAAFRDDQTTDVFLSADHAGVDVTDAAGLAAKIAQPDCVVLVATDPEDEEGGEEGTLVAHCSVRKVVGDGDDDSNKDGDRPSLRPRGWIGLLAVDVRRKGRGLGSQMLAHAERYAHREWGIARLELDVVCTRAELRAWYARRGYRETGQTTPFPYAYHGDWQGVLRDDLHFVVLGKDVDEADTATAVE